MFAVIENQQEFFTLESERNRLIDAAAFLLAHAQRLGGDAGDKLGIGDWRKVDKPDAVGILVNQLGTDRPPFSSG
jgi:hypothetical protein